VAFRKSHVNMAFLNLALELSGHLRLPQVFSALKKNGMRENLTVLVFHHIVESFASPFVYDWDHVSCDIGMFREILDFLRKHFHITTFEHYLPPYRAKTVYHKPPLIVTFSNGYRSIYSIAAPEMLQLNLNGTVFLPTEAIDRNRPLWQDSVAFYVNSVGMNKFYEEIFTPFFYRDPLLKYHINDNNHKFFIRSLIDFLKKLPMGDFLLFFEQMESLLGSVCTGWTQDKHLLNWEEIKELSNAGFEVGLQGGNHLAAFPSDSEQFRNALNQSKCDVKKNTGKNVSVFFYSRENIEQVRKLQAKILQEEHFLYGVTLDQGINFPGFNPYRLKSYRIDHNTCIDRLGCSLFICDLDKVSERAHRIFQASQEIFAKSKQGLKLIPSKVKALSRCRMRTGRPCHIFFSICDHFEPYSDRVCHSKAITRVLKFKEKFSEIAFRHRDADGFFPKVTAFYPEEEYKKELLDILAEMCDQGFIETEIHLHHDNDNAENLFALLTDYKKLLASEHRMLSTDSNTGEIAYGFIHGNWALDNSGINGRWCGVNNEISVLMQTGCFADFTMPSAPHKTQTRKINSIYYAADDPLKPKSHDTGTNVRFGVNKGEGLLMVQGPLTIRMNGIGFCIENGEITRDNPPFEERIDAWIQQCVSVKGKPDWIFCKVHTHGAQDSVMKQLFDNNWYEKMFRYLEANYNDGSRFILHYVSAREMANIILSLEDGCGEWSTALRDFRYKKIS